MRSLPPKIAIVVPTKDEQDAIAAVVRDCREALQGIDHEIIVVDESRDNTAVEAAPTMHGLSGWCAPSNPASTCHRVSDLALRASSSLSHSWLDGVWRRSHRNRSWGRLSIAEKGMFRCALWVAKARGKISNMKLMVHVLRIALKLLKTYRSRIVNAGRRRATQMFAEYSKPGGVFSWAPRMRERLYDPGYVRYLGMLELNS